MRLGLRSSSAAVLAGLLLVGAAACGDDGGSGGDSQGVTVATPFPSAIAFPDLYIALANGYFEDEGLDLSIEPLDGSGAALQALETGQADVAMASPAPIMQALEQGSDIVSIYTGYQGGIFSLVTSADSAAQSLEDLAGTTIGVGALDGGEVPVVRAMLADVGLQEGEDYELLAVGDGGTAGPALNNGDVSAYGAAFIDVLILESTGAELRDLTPEGFNGGTDNHFTVSRETFEDDDEFVADFGRALAKGAQWLFDNRDDALTVICDAGFPEECEDEEFAGAILDEVVAFMELPPEADGQWGFTDIELVQGFADVLTSQGELEETADVQAIFRNDYVADYNDFEPGEL